VGTGKKLIMMCRSKLMQLRALVILISCVLTSSWAVAQTKVVDAGRTPSNDVMVTLYNQVQALQQEVQTLRGVLEEQGYQLKRLQTESRDRYLDVDRRLSMMSPTVQPPTMPAPAVTTPPPDLRDSSAAISDSSVVTQTPPPITTSAAKPEVVSKRDPDGSELYRRATKLLLEEYKYQEAVEAYQNYVDMFPKGRYVANALYWIGEAYLLIPDSADKAIKAFERVISDYPKDQKAPGSMLKMGKAYKQKDESDKASEIWRRIKVLYPDAVDEIRLADQELRTL
jgi:tol-pal system protein YbgF